MGLKAIELTLAERYLLSDWLGSLTKGDVNTARNVREIGRRLEVRQARKAVQKANELLREYGMFLPWEDLYYYQENTTEDVFDERLKQEKDAKERKRLENVGTVLRRVCSPDTELYTIDEAYLGFLREQGGEKDWATIQQRVDTPTGPKFETVQVPPPPGKLELFADLVDKVNAACLAPDYRAKAEPDTAS